MKKSLIASLILAVTTGALTMTMFGCAKESSNSKAGKVDQKLRHVVLFKFKDGTDPADAQKVVDAFAALPAQIPQIIEFEHGTDVSVENKAQGFTHCFLVTFANEKDRDIYIDHPAHKAFGDVLNPYRDKVFVVDYYAK